jgi:hypothetical protein
MSQSLPLRRTMAPYRSAILLLLLALTVTVVRAQTPSAMSGYQFQYLTGGSLTDMSGSTTLINGSPAVDDGASALTNIGFTFNFGGVNYTNFSASSNGLLTFGSTATTSFTITMSTSPYPWVSAMGVDQYTRGDGVRYKLIGVSPNRTLVVQWDIFRYNTSSSTALYEVRLQETSNEVSFVYGASASGVTNWNGRVGLVAGSSNYLQVNTTTNATSLSDVTTNTTFPASGTIYRFFVCSPNISIAGNTAQGAQTANMLNGETILAGTQVQRGSSASYLPFTITNPAAACGPRTFTYAITGPAAADYALSTTTGTLAAGASNAPVLTFTPQGTGIRTATLTIVDNGTPQFQRSYTLSAIGTPRFVVTGNPTQGGTALMNSGDTLLSQVVLYHGTCANYTPFNLANTNLSPGTSPLTYTLVLDSAGAATTQYSIVGASTGTLTPGVAVTPTIRFCPTAIAFGPQEARLRVTTSDGDSRIYVLRALAGAPQVRFSINGAEQLPGSVVFNQTTTCVGEEAVSVPLVLTNIGIGDVNISSVAVYQTDTTYQQGTPQLPLTRDAQGRLVPVNGYILTSQPGVAPIGANTAAVFPIVIPEGQSRTYYLTYVGPAAGRRFGRAFIRTTGENFIGIDTNAYNNTTVMPTRTLGLMTLEFVARSVGSQLAATAAGERIRPLVFDGVRIGDTLQKSFRVANAGACVLRISRDQLRIFSGDVNEFKLVSILPGSAMDPASGDYLIAPGASDSIIVRFIPSRSGTRMATLRFRTNDSSMGIAGVTERGVYLMDIQGRGRAGLDPRDLVLDPVAVGSSSVGTAVLENSSTVAVEIGQIVFVGGDAAQFAENTSAPWPARPSIVLPGSKLNVSVRMTPVGDPGDRRTQLLVITTSGDTARVNVRGEAGTQNLVVSPTSLFENLVIPSGSAVRQVVRISNNGTLPIRIETPMLSGPDSANYRLGSLPRLDIGPGATEYLEVTFAPINGGQSSAEIAITPVGGTTQVVTLGGEAIRVRGDDDPTAALAFDGAPSRVEEWTDGVSGVDRDVATSGMRLSAPMPNPASNSVVIAYALTARSDVSIVLFDASGRMVRELASTTVDAGEHRLSVDVSDLSAGVYHYRLSVGGRTLSRSLVIAR